MKTRRDACDPDRLRHLLEDRLDDDDQAELAEHLDGCHHCRKTLDNLAGGSLWWHEARRFLGDHTETKVTPNDALDFLTPSENPDHLGRLGSYEVISVLGRGGMGLVLRAIDPALNRQVAIKVLAPELATSATARRRFAREGRAAAAISHDHIVAIHSVDASGGLPYLVMQLVAGRSLQERIDQTGPLAVAEILRIGMQTASGLAAAHAVGLIHRDIKPSNILLENCVERVKITDFGLARAVDDASLTQSGVVAGTPQYMSPEQARGEPADHRSDLFSLGSVLYALCTGRAPFRADSTPAVLRRVSEDTPRPILELNPEIPAWLERVVTRLHAKNPADRYQSANEVADLLCRCLAHVQAPASVPLPEELTGREAKRTHRRKLAIAAVIGLLALCGLGAAEATGVTKVISTVVRFTTAQGTLKVTINDPNIKVRVDDKDLVITGAGLEEVRVNAGVHRVVGSKDGKTIEKLVSVTRGGIETVEVSLEPDAVVAQATTQDETARGGILLAEADLVRASDRLDWSQKMFLKGYVSQSVLTADMLALQKAKFSLDEAKRKSRPIAQFIAPAAEPKADLRAARIDSKPSEVAESIFKRIQAVKNDLTTLNQRRQRLNEQVRVVGPKALLDPAVLRSETLISVTGQIRFVETIECEILDLTGLVTKGIANVPALQPLLSSSIASLGELKDEFVSLHRGYQALFKEASALALRQPRIAQIDAILQVMNGPPLDSPPNFESMSGSLELFQAHSSKPDKALDAAITELYEAEKELADLLAARPDDRPKTTITNNPLGTPEALAKRADYLKETLAKLTLIAAHFRAAVESKEVDKAVYRKGISTQLCEMFNTVAVLDHEFFDLRSRIEQATGNAARFDNGFSETLARISGLDAQFALIHQELQTLLDQASHNAASKPGIDQLDAIVQVMKTPKTAQMPPYESMFGSIQRLRKHAGKTDSALDAMLVQLMKVEQEHPGTKEAEWHKLEVLRTELRQREEAQAALENLRQRVLPKQDDAAKAKQLQLRFDAYRKGLSESVAKEKNDPVITALREEIARLQTELNSLRVKSNSNDKPIVLDPPDKPKKP